MSVSLNNNALTLLSTAKDYLDIPSSVADYDDRITRFINQASSLIESHTKRVLVTTTHTEYYDGRRTNRLQLNQFPIIGGSATDNKPELFFGPRDFTPVAADNYDFDESDIVYFSTLPKGTRNIKVIYQAGLGLVDAVAGTNTLPADLELACLNTVLWLYDSQTDRRAGKESRTKGDESVSYNLGLPQEVIELLDKGYTREEMPSLAPVGISNR
jgi:hypothetical protein